MMNAILYSLIPAGPIGFLVGLGSIPAYYLYYRSAPGIFVALLASSAPDRFYPA